MEQDAATVAFGSPDVRTTVRHACIPVEWAVTGARAVALNSTPAAASGAAESCGGARPRLTVTFENGRSRDYRLARAVLFDQPPVRLLLALAIIATLTSAHYAGWLTPLYQRTGTFLERRVPGLAADWRELARLFRLNLNEASRSHRWSLFAILAVALGVRVLYLATPMAIDEAITYTDFVRLPIFESLSSYSAPNNHLFHTVLAHISVSLFGAQEWGVRLPAFLCGLLAVPMTYVVGLRLYNRNVALVGAAFVSASVLMIEYSVNARGYSLGTLIFLVQIVLAWHLRQRNNRLGWGLFGGLSAISLAAVPTMLYAVASVEAWLLITILLENNERERVRLTTSFFLSGLLTVALTLLFYSGVILSDLQALIANRYILPQGLRGTILSLPRHIVNTTWLTWHEDFPPILDWLMLIGFGIGLSFHPRLSRSRIPVGLVVMLVPLGIVVVQRALPLVRSWQFAIPLYFMVASAGLLFVIQRLAGRPNRVMAFGPALALVITVGLTALVVADQSLPKRAPLPEATEITLALEPRLYTDDLVLLDPGYRPLRYYFDLMGLDGEQVRNRNRHHAPGIYLVVQSGQTVDTLLEIMEVDATAYSEPALVERFDAAEVYLLLRSTAST